MASIEARTGFEPMDNRVAACGLCPLANRALMLKIWRPRWDSNPRLSLSKSESLIPLSYGAICSYKFWPSRMDSNHRPQPSQGCALIPLSYGKICLCSLFNFQCAKLGRGNRSVNPQYSIVNFATGVGVDPTTESFKGFPPGRWPGSEVGSGSEIRTPIH